MYIQGSRIFGVVRFTIAFGSAWRRYVFSLYTCLGFAPVWWVQRLFLLCISERTQTTVRRPRKPPSFLKSFSPPSGTAASVRRFTSLRPPVRDRPHATRLASVHRPEPGGDVAHTERFGRQTVAYANAERRRRRQQDRLGSRRRILDHRELRQHQQQQRVHIDFFQTSRTRRTVTGRFAIEIAWQTDRRTGTVWFETRYRCVQRIRRSTGQRRTL